MSKHRPITTEQKAEALQKAQPRVYDLIRAKGAGSVLKSAGPAHGLAAAFASDHPDAFEFIASGAAGATATAAPRATAAAPAYVPPPPSDPIAEWDRELKAATAAANGNKFKAVNALASARPELHAAYLAATSARALAALHR